MRREVKQCKKYVIFFWEELKDKKLVVLGAAGTSFLILKGMIFFNLEVGTLWYWFGILSSTLIAIWPLITSARDSCKKKNVVKKLLVLSVGCIAIVLVAYQLLKEFSFFIYS